MQSKKLSNPEHFNYFKTDIQNIALPEKFTFPFYNEPHQLSLIAATELQKYLESLTELDHNFGLEADKNGLVIGKMFGVLVVKNQEGVLGYLSAFSGKLANSNHHVGFVPPVFDILTENGFFKQEELQLNLLNEQISTLENSEEFESLLKNFRTCSEKNLLQIKETKEQIKQAKQERKELREQLEVNVNLTISEKELKFENLRKASIKEQYYLKDLLKNSKEEILMLELECNHFKAKIDLLKEERKQKSAALQQKLFEQYSFLNQFGEHKSLNAIFENTTDQKPPAGAGECAAPKLLHYAFQHQLKPIALAEFWWGQSPKSEVRKHKQFYPACKGKCEPILSHMLKGVEMDENPMLINPALGKELTIIFEDEYLVAINKPAEFLSVPGKAISDSVYTRMLEKYPNATGPLIVHRLDMSTSGILLIAKTKEIHKNLQSQFIKRKVTKRYVALLARELTVTEGIIDLPLRVDLDDRPRQLVCYEHGKPAQTRFEVLEKKDGKTKVYFYPITGRTHQLRVHASHSLGLNAPIVGDDLYGTKTNRLHLHAESITFRHPITNEFMTLQVDAEF